MNVKADSLKSRAELLRENEQLRAALHEQVQSAIRNRATHHEYERMLETKVAELEALAKYSERWRLAYQDGKMKLYEMGGEVADAALTHLPCNEAGVDRLSRSAFLYPHFEVWKKEKQALEAQVAALSAPVSEEERRNYGWHASFTAADVNFLIAARVSKLTGSKESE